MAKAVFLRKPVDVAELKSRATKPSEGSQVCNRGDSGAYPG